MDSPPPIDLSHVSAVGATYDGRKVTRLELVTESGTVVALKFRPAAPPRDAADTPMARAVLAVFEEHDGPLPAREVARLAGYKYSGKLRETLAALVDARELTRDADGDFAPA